MYFLLTTNYVHFKQKSLLQFYDKISMKSIKTLLDNNYMKIIWSKYHRINYHIDDLCQSIDGLNRFWSRYVTIQYTLNISFVTYSLYILFYVKLELIEKQVFILVISYSTFILVVLICLCAKIVQNNRILDLQNRNYLLKFESSQIFRPSLIIKVLFLYLNLISMIFFINSRK